MANKIWLLTALGLAACGGGGNSNPGSPGTSGAAATTTSASVAAPTTTTTSTTTTTTTPTTNSTTGDVFSLQGGGTLQLTYDASGALTGATLAQGGADTVFGPANGTVPPNASPYAGGATVYAYAGGQPTMALESMGGANGLSSSDFGIWTSYAGGAATGTNFYAGGVPTSAADLPMQGAGITATYNGNYIANLSAPTIYAGNQIAAGPFSGSVQISADFDKQTLSATFGGLLSSQISMGSTYDPQTAAYTINGNTASNFAFGTFTLSGGFYGSSTPTTAPPETVGKLSGSLGSATGTYTGAFGAKR